MKRKSKSYGPVWMRRPVRRDPKAINRVVDADGKLIVYVNVARISSNQLDRRMRFIMRAINDGALWK